MRAPRSLAIAAVVLAATGSASCIDPVHTDDVNALGGEVGKHGPRHRPGQPCLTCHGGSGPGSPDFAIAGTIYASRGKPQAMGGVSVVLTDANNVTKTTTSNDAGNFYINATQWSPTYPISVALQSGSQSKVMKSRIGRNGSCAACHYGADNEASHMPPVFMSDL